MFNHPKLLCGSTATAASLQSSPWRSLASPPHPPTLVPSPLSLSLILCPCFGTCNLTVQFDDFSFICSSCIGSAACQRHLTFSLFFLFWFKLWNRIEIVQKKFILKPVCHFLRYLLTLHLKHVKSVMSRVYTRKPGKASLRVSWVCFAFQGHSEDGTHFVWRLQFMQALFFRVCGGRF